MNNEYKKTYIAGKKTKPEHLVKGDIVYARKMINGYSETFELSFLKLERGIITGTVLRHSWNGNKFGATSRIQMTARVANCFIWGKVREEITKAEVTHWLNEADTVPEADSKNTLWFIWSNEHRGWWKPHHRGYTTIKKQAGLYSYAEALKIVEGANIGDHDVPNEAMILFIEE